MKIEEMSTEELKREYLEAEVKENRSARTKRNIRIIACLIALIIAIVLIAKTIKIMGNDLDTTQANTYYSESK